MAPPPPFTLTFDPVGVNEEEFIFEKTILSLTYNCNYKIAIGVGVVFVSKFVCLFIISLLGYMR